MATVQPEPEGPSAAVDLPAIVGIGITVEGLDACAELLKSLDRELEIAVVIVPRVSVHETEGLIERLARESKLTIDLLVDGQQLQRDHVVVAPPAVEPFLIDRQVRLLTALAGRGDPRPIDRLFQSLAAQRGTRALGVLLGRGADDDGAHGVKAIQAVGGSTFADSAHADWRATLPGSSPVRVDFVLPPIEISRELARIVRTPPPSAAASHTMPAAPLLATDASSRDVRREADRLVLTKLAPPGVVIGDDLGILEFRGSTSAYLEHRSGAASFDLLRMARAELRVPLRQTIDEARIRCATARRTALLLEATSAPHVVELEVMPFWMPPSQQVYFIVSFRDAGHADARADAERSTEEQAPAEQAPQPDTPPASLILDQLASSNDELQAANEELRALEAELRSTNDQLLAANRELTSIIDDVPECLLVLSSDLHVRSANRAFQDVFALGPKQLEGKPLHALGSGPWNAPQLRGQLLTLDQRGSFDDFRVDYDLPERGRRIFALAARRLEGSGPILLTLEDITAREQAARAAERTEAQVREALVGASEAILMIDRSGTIEFANHAAVELFGYEAEELMGSAIEVLVPERFRARHVQLREAYAQGPAPRRIGNGRMLFGRRKDGSEFPIEVALSPRALQGAQSIVCFVTDLTTHKDSEQKIRSYQESLRRMAFDAALAEERERRRIAVDLHDRIGQSLALAQMKLDGARAALSGEPRDAVAQAVELIKQSIVDARSLTFELSPPILYDLGLKEALSWLAEDMERRCGIRIELKTDDVIVPFDDTSSALVFRAVRELLMNVFKHANSPSAVVSLQRDGDAIRIDVEDRGVGFDVSDVTSRTPGSGFGLFSVREQVGRLGGSLEINSAPQRGTLASLRIPVLKPDGWDSPAAASEKTK